MPLLPNSTRRPKKVYFPLLVANMWYLLMIMFLMLGYKGTPVVSEPPLSVPSIPALSAVGPHRSTQSWLPALSTGGPQQFQHVRWMLLLLHQPIPLGLQPSAREDPSNFSKVLLMLLLLHQPICLGQANNGKHLILSSAFKIHKR